MELAIPFIALSGLYIINRQQEKREGLKRSIITENFSNQTLPNVSPIAPNYPRLNTANSNNPPLENNLNYYDTPNPATDTYLNQSLYEKKENILCRDRIYQDVRQLHVYVLLLNRLP